MSSAPFADLPSEQFRRQLAPASRAIYGRLFPGCDVAEISTGEQPNELDRQLGIDAVIKLPTGARLTVQEKFRRGDVLGRPELRVRKDSPDFTQEWMNAAGTANESPGEWFKLSAQLYFYGWADEQEQGFAKWVLMDVARYIMLANRAGGLAGLGGVLQANSQNGDRASFYAIPMKSLRWAWIATGGKGLIFWGPEQKPDPSNVPPRKAG